MPTKDEQQNYQLLSMTESNGETIMTFQRLIDTKDSNDFPITVRPFLLFLPSFVLTKQESVLKSSILL